MSIIGQGLRSRALVTQGYSPLQQIARTFLAVVRSLSFAGRAR